MSRRIVFLVWRDTSHPDGGGSEVFIERVAEWLAASGDDVTIVCAAHDNAPADSMRAGVRYRRRGGRLGVYPHGLLYLMSRAGRRADLVIDVQNGLPFWSRLVRRRPLMVLVHHCHREQWRILFPGKVGALGSWLETWLAPRVYRNCPYVTVSQATKADLVAQGVSPTRVSVVHNGVDAPKRPAVGRSERPTISVLSRLVPHKQIEHALDAVAEVRNQVPDVHLDVIGDGWWAPHLHEHAQEAGIADAVTFHGYLDEDQRDDVLSRSWLFVLPSIKEGWGIAIMEAATRRVPTVAYRHAGGVAESIVDDVTGILVDDRTELAKKCAELLGDEASLERLGRAAAERAAAFSWGATGAAFAATVDAALRGRASA